ncbi:MAG TPA: sugar phosphate isomerase/epimerase, partial [Planctomycetota bacterium]|nr:sugar phosphate isomerase/epimerase [Planctomycetota bacterium]
MTTRREILKAAAIGAAAAWLPGFRQAEAIKLGVASYSLRKFSRAKAIEIVKACGTPYVNLKSMHLPYGLSAEETAAARKGFDDAGLKVVGSGNNSLKNEKEIAALFDYAKAARFPLLVIAPDPDLLPRIEEAVKKSGIAVAIHNHGPEDKMFPAPSDALKRIKDMDPRVGLCVDVGHTTRTGK